MTDGNNLPITNLEERLRVLTERVAKLEQERSKSLLGRLFDGRGVPVVLALVLVLGGAGILYVSQ